MKLFWKVHEILESKNNSFAILGLVIFLLKLFNSYYKVVILSEKKKSFFKCARFCRAFTPLDLFCYSCLNAYRFEDKASRSHYA